MESAPRYPASILAADFVVVLLSVMGFVVTMQKADLPFGLNRAPDGRLAITGVVEALSPLGLAADASLVAINGYPIGAQRIAEDIIDGYASTDVVTVAVQDRSGTREIRVPLIRYYSGIYLGIQAATAALIFFLGVLVSLKKPRNHAAQLFHAVALCTVLLLMLARGRYGALPLGIGHILRALFPSTAVFTGATLLHFSTAYPFQRTSGKTLLRAVYGTSLLITVLGCYTSLRATFPVSVEWAALHMYASSAARIALLVFAAGAIGMFLSSYRHSSEEAQRKKLRWILLGSAVSIAGFAAFWQVPQLLLGRELIPEEAMLLIVTIFPVSVAISIIRYRMFDIDTLIQRSSVYSIVFILLLLLFAATHQGLIEILGLITAGNRRMATLLAGVAIIIAFQPVRTLVQKLLDRWFFHIRYSFQEAVNAFIDAIKSAMDPQQLADLLVNKTAEFIPVERIGVLLADPDKGKLELVARVGMPPADERVLAGLPVDVAGDPAIPIAFRERVETDVRTNIADAGRFDALGAALTIPLTAESGSLHGYLVLGNKVSRFPFTLDDVDLLRTIAYQAGSVAERIGLQERLLEKRAEAARLQETNRMKSFFVATVSHELKTPLTSIKMFAELLRTKRRQGSVDLDEYLSIIEGECERLTHLINNVLDYSKIEAGVKHYSFMQCDAHAILRQALEIMKYPLSMRRFRLDVSLVDRECYIHADHAAVLEALINILSNAIKYSPKVKHITVSTTITDGRFAISVADRGAGISSEDQPHIFDSFYRANDVVIQRAGGTGLGLALVKHVMDAHGGSVEFSSVPGSGSTFTLFFPFTA
jgi:signal transduction histidine kinase